MQLNQAFSSQGTYKLSVYLCHLLKTFAYRLDPDQARQNIGPDLDPICLIYLKYFFKKVDFQKISRRQKSIKKVCSVQDRPFNDKTYEST